MIVLLTLVLLALASVADAASNRLDWVDNSNGDQQEQFFEIERKTVPNPTPLPTTPPHTIDCAGTPGTYAMIATTVNPNIIQYIDAAVAPGLSYCYRVRASNATGKSGYSNEAGRYVPFGVPANPSGLGVTAGP